VGGHVAGWRIEAPRGWGAASDASPENCDFFKISKWCVSVHSVNGHGPLPGFTATAVDPWKEAMLSSQSVTV